MRGKVNHHAHQNQTRSSLIGPCLLGLFADTLAEERLSPHVIELGTHHAARHMLYMIELLQGFVKSFPLDEPPHVGQGVHDSSLLFRVARLRRG